MMWLALSNGWLSIVAHRDKPGHVLVRARNQNHIESYFPTQTSTSLQMQTIRTGQIFVALL